MLRAVYPVLDALLQRPAWRANETVVTAVCEVYGHVMCAVKVRLRVITPRDSGCGCCTGCFESVRAARVLTPNLELTVPGCIIILASPKDCYLPVR